MSTYVTRGLQLKCWHDVDDGLYYCTQASAAVYYTQRNAETWYKTRYREKSNNIIILNNTVEEQSSSEYWCKSCTQVHSHDDRDGYNTAIYILCTLYRLPPETHRWAPSRRSRRKSQYVGSIWIYYIIISTRHLWGRISVAAFALDIILLGNMCASCIIYNIILCTRVQYAHGVTLLSWPG